MWAYLPLLAIGVINFTGIAVWAVSSFGNGIVYHIGWQVCSLLSEGRVCSGSISVVVVHITMAAVFLFPSQLLILREHVNWRLALHLTLSQQLGLYVGMYVLFLAETAWLGRSLGLLFFLVAVHMAVAEGSWKPPPAAAAASSPTSVPAAVDDADRPVPPPLPSSYAVDSWARRGTVWLTGASSGLCSGLFGTGGPPMMLFVAWNSLPSTETRATLALCEVFNNTGRVVFLLFFQSKINVLTASYGGVFVALSVSGFVGLVLGNAVAKRTDQVAFRRVLLALLAVGSVLIAARGCPWQQVLAVAGGGAAVMAAALAASALWARHRRRSSGSCGGGVDGEAGGGLTSVELMARESDSNAPAAMYSPVSYLSPSTAAAKGRNGGSSRGRKGDEEEEDVDVLASFLEEECPAPGTQGSDSPPAGLWSTLFGGGGGPGGGGEGKDKKYVVVDSADLDEDVFDNVLF